MRGPRGTYRKSYIVPHGRGFKYVRAIPKDLQSLEKKTAWVRCLGPIGRAEAAAKARVLALEHGKRIMALRALIELRREISPTQATKSKVAARTCDLMSLVELWEKIRQPRSTRTTQKVRRGMGRFIEVVGNLDPQAITRSHVIAYRDALERKLGMTAQNIAEHLETLHTVFNVAFGEGLIPTNPAYKVKARKANGKFAIGRQGLTSEHVCRIFEALNGESQELKWIVRLLAYHGMRSGEVCQLRCEDVTLLHGVPVFRVHDRYGSVKNEPSIRDIPIHPECMGILEYAQEVVAKHGPNAWLFSSLPVKDQGKADWFHKYGSKFLRQKVGIMDRRYTMHSFRHLWRTLARECEMPESVSSSLMGHALGKGEHGAYGSAPSLNLRAQWMARIDLGKA